jgi:hypothetical protein
LAAVNQHLDAEEAIIKPKIWHFIYQWKNHASAL